MTAGRDIEVYRKAYLPFILHEKKIPVILNHKSIKYITKIANKQIFKKEMIIIKNSREKFKNGTCSTKEKLIDYLKLTYDYYILGSKIPKFDEILYSYNLDDFLLIVPNLLLSKIVNKSPRNEIEKTINFINDNLDEVIQISKNSLVSARSLLMVTIWINHFKFNKLEPFGDFRCNQIILYRLRDIFIHLGDSVNCQLVELFLDTEYGHKKFSPISYCP